jgi:hypothetical protein
VSKGLTMTEHWLCVEDYLLSAKHRNDQEIEPEPQELVDQDWREAFE